jgi:hypothetical protein
MPNYSSSPTLLDDYVSTHLESSLLKRKREIQERKKAALRAFTNTIDGDTSVIDNQSVRFGAPNISLDTAETAKDFRSRYDEDPELLAKHARSIAATRGLAPSEVTREMVEQHGAEVAAYSKALQMEGQDPNNPQMQVTSHGVDKYGREVAELVNPVTGVNITKALNTPEHNLDYFSKFNQPFDSNYAQKGDTEISDVKPRAQVYQDDDGTYTVMSEGDYGILQTGLTKEEADRWVQVAQQVDTTKIEAEAGTAESFLNRITTSLSIAERTQAKAATSIASTVTDNEDAIGILSSILNPFNAFTNAKRSWNNQIKSPKDLAVSNKEYNEYTEEIRSKLDNRQAEYDRIVSGDLAEKGEYVESLLYNVNNRKMAAFESVLESSALMMELGLGVPGIGLAVVDATARMTEDYKKANNGAQPTLEHQALIVALAGISTMGELLKFKGLTGSFKTLNKWVTEVTSKSSSLTRFMAGVSSKFIGGVLGEAASGIISEAAEKQAKDLPKGLSPITAAEALEAGSMEALGGIGPTAVSSTVTSAANSSDSAVLKNVLQELQTPDTIALDIEEESALNKQIDALETKLTDPSISEKHRERLDNKREALVAQRTEGRPNPDKLSAERRALLEEQKDILKKKVFPEASKSPESTFSLDTETVPFRTVDEIFEDVAPSLADTDAAAMESGELQEVLGNALQAEGELTGIIEDVDSSMEEIAEAEALLDKIQTARETWKEQYISRAEVSERASEKASEETKDSFVYSLTDLNKTSPEEASNIVADIIASKSATTAEKQMAKAKLGLIKARAKISGEGKSLEDVNYEITSATGNEYQSVDELVAAATTPETQVQGMDQLNKFTTRMQKKAKAFKEAITDAPPEGFIVNKEDLSIAPSNVPENERYEGDDGWLVRPRTSDRLVASLQDEAAYATAALTAATKMQETITAKEGSLKAEPSSKVDTVLDLLSKSKKAPTKLTGDVGSLAKNVKAQQAKAKKTEDSQSIIDKVTQVPKKAEATKEVVEKVEEGVKESVEEKVEETSDTGPLVYTNKVQVSQDTAFTKYLVDGKLVPSKLKEASVEDLRSLAKKLGVCK